MGLRIIECRGSGRQIGRIVGEEGKQSIRRNIDLCTQPDPDDLRRRLPGFLRTLEAYSPDALEEMRGMAEAANVPLEQIYVLNFPLFPGALDDSEGCTNVVFRNTSRGPLWGKNNDGLEPTTRRDDYLKYMLRSMGIPAIIYTYYGYVATCNGMNAEGVVVGSSSVGSVFQQSDSYPEMRLWAYKCLLEAPSARQFLRAFSSRPVRGKGATLVLADRGGTCWSIDLACPLVQLNLPVDPKGTFCVNRYGLPYLKDADRRSPEGKEDALSRACHLSKFFEAQASFDIEDMKRLLSHHGEQDICRHWDRGGIMNTEASLIGIPKENTLLYCADHPCQGEYMEFQF